MDGQTNELTNNGWMEQKIEQFRKMFKIIEALNNMDGWIDRQTNEWTNNGWMDGTKDRRIEISR